MKKSNYNFIVYDDGWGYWYNAVSGCYFRLSENLSRKIESVLTAMPTKDFIPSESLFDKLISSGFIVDDGEDELNIIRSRHKQAVYDKNYFLVILPTLNCNYKCWYCIQSHIPSIMETPVVESVCRHIDRMIAEEGITSLHLDWFGGEPFMFFDRIIKPISRYAINKCEEYGIPFFNSSTTNGYFIDGKVSKQLADLKFIHFQITLDGEKQHHDKVKYVKGCQSAFDHVLKNINRMLIDNEKISVYLRINYTHQTLTTKIVGEVNEHIEPSVRRRVVITPKKVWQESIDKGFHSTVVSVLDLFEKSGYRVSRREISSSFIPCYVNQKYYNAINYNGNVVKCTACDDLYAEDPKGELMPDGEIKWKEKFDEKCIEATFENEMCLSCKRLPVCMGPCPRDHQLGHTRCKYEAMDEDFDIALLDYLKNEYK